MRWRRGPTIQVSRHAASPCASFLQQCAASHDTSGIKDPPSYTAALIDQSQPTERVHRPLTALCALAAGHYTIEACETSQYEQHVRAVLGWPLGSPALKVRRVFSEFQQGLGAQHIQS